MLHRRFSLLDRRLSQAVLSSHLCSLHNSEFANELQVRVFNLNFSSTPLPEIEPQAGGCELDGSDPGAELASDSDLELRLEGTLYTMQ